MSDLADASSPVCQWWFSAKRQTNPKASGWRAAFAHSSCCAAPVRESLWTPVGQECPPSISEAVQCDTERQGVPSMGLVQDSEPHVCPAARYHRQDTCMRKSWAVGGVVSMDGGTSTGQIHAKFHRGRRVSEAVALLHHLRTLFQTAAAAGRDTG